MASFLSGWSGKGDADPERIARIRVAVVGPQGCGKTSLVHLLAHGRPAAPAPRPTVGGGVQLLLATYPHERAKACGQPALAGQAFFVELWDVSGAQRYAGVRPLYWHALNGVVLVHDATNSRSLASLQRWAADVAAGGSFQATLSDDRTALSPGGLPVPALMVGNKADLLPRYRRKHARSWAEEFWEGAAIWLQAAPGRLLDAAGGFLSSLRPGGGSSGGGGGGGTHSRSSSGHLRKNPSLLLHSNLQASAREGDLDKHAVTDFFYDLFERRYCPGSTAASGGGGGLAAAAAALVGSRPSFEGRLPPVMYTSISEESSPAKSLRSSSNTPYHAGTGRIDDLI